MKAVEFNDGSVHYYANGSFSFEQDIIVTGNTTLVIANATIRFVQTRNNQYGIELSGSASGDPRLEVRNSTFTSTRSFEVSLFDASSAFVNNLNFTGSTSSSIKLYGNASLTALDSRLAFVYCYDYSRSSAVGCRQALFFVYDYSFANISGSTFDRVQVYDYGKASVSLCTVSYAIRAEDMAEIMVTASSLLGEIYSGQNSSVSLDDINLYQFKVRCYNNGNITVFSAASTPSKYPGEFWLDGSAQISLDNCSLTDAIYRVKGNSTLEVKNSLLGSSIFYCYNFSETKFSDSYADWLIEALQQSKVNASNSDLNVVSAEDDSSIYLDNCQVGRFRCYESAEVLVLNSNAEEVLVELMSVNQTFHGFSEGYRDSVGLSAVGLNATFLNTSIETGWSFRFLGSSNITFYDSKLRNLDLFDDSKVYLWNTSYTAVNVRDNAEVVVWSYLMVRVIDYFGRPVEGVNLTVTVPASYEYGVSDENGEAVFQLFERNVNASGDFPVETYVLTIVFDGSSYSYDVVLEGSKTFVYTVASPWWYFYMFYGLGVCAVVVAGAVIVWFFKRKRASKG
ncbi:hypothetical protein HXY33_03490 [Candidatus Bathyarchaeota archaeon]|nr:hypothetical protein [Candidatus Bathyarchaeota archaeon]